MIEARLQLAAPRPELVDAVKLLDIDPWALDRAAASITGVTYRTKLVDARLVA